VESSFPEVTGCSAYYLAPFSLPDQGYPFSVATFLILLNLTKEASTKSWSRLFCRTFPSPSSFPCVYPLRLPGCFLLFPSCTRSNSKAVRPRDFPMMDTSLRWSRALFSLTGPLSFRPSFSDVLPYISRFWPSKPFRSRTYGFFFFRFITLFFSPCDAHGRPMLGQFSFLPFFNRWRCLRNLHPWSISNVFSFLFLLRSARCDVYFRSILTMCFSVLLLPPSDLCLS